MVTKDSTVVIYTEKQETKGKILVPDLTGFTLDEAFEALKERGLNMRASSLGEVFRQSIPKGSYVEIGSIIEIELINDDIETAG